MSDTHKDAREAWPVRMFSQDRYDDKIDAMRRKEHNPYLFAVPPLEYPVNSVEWLWHDRLHIEDKRNTERLLEYHDRLFAYELRTGDVRRTRQ